MAGLSRGRSRSNQLEDFRTARRAELVAICSLFLVLLWGACLIPLPAGRGHEPGANDSLLYHSILGRFMGNTVRMRPRDKHGRAYGIDSELIPKYAADEGTDSLTDVRVIAERWLEAEKAAARPLDQAPADGSGGTAARIRIRARTSAAEDRRDEAPQQPATLTLHSQTLATPFAASRGEEGAGEDNAPDLDGGFLVENPGEENLAGDMAVGEEDSGLAAKAAQYVADTLQAKSKAATLGENIVDAEAARVAGSDGSRVASEQSLAKAMQAAAIAAEEGKGKAKSGEEEVKRTGGVTKGGAAGASERAKTAAKEAFEAWQARNRLPAETDEDLLRPIPEPLVFTIDSPELLDEDMKEILEMSENLEQDHQGKDDESENVRAVDADNMDEESLQEAVGLLSQLEAYKKETLGQEALLKEREEAILAARKRKFEEQEYREKIRKDKSAVYDHYLWRKLLMAAYASHVDYMMSPEWEARFSAKIKRLQQGKLTRGIVIPAGGNVLLNHAWATLTVLRESLNCTLPIEIIYNGPLEMDAWSIKTFESSFKDVRCVNGGAVPLPPHGRQLQAEGDGPPTEEDKDMPKVVHDISGFAHKVHSLVTVTSFDEVLLLDADNLPLANPEKLFESEEYRRNGALFFPDWWDAGGWMRPAAYTLFGLTPPWLMQGGADFKTSESGQMLFNRLWHADVLEWVWFLNSYPEVMYRTMYGDKDTFRIAFHLAGKAEMFSQVQTPPRAVLDATPEDVGDRDFPANHERKGLMLQEDAAVRFLHVGMLQHDPAGRLAFLHRTAEGKFLPQRDSFRRFHLLTVPLSPSRAAALLGGLHKHMGYDTYQIDFQTYRDCPVPDERRFLEICNIDVASPKFPIPVQPAADFPEIMRVVHRCEAEYEYLQRRYKGTIVLG